MPQEEVQEAAQKGGATSAGGFATMDPDKQVYPSLKHNRTHYVKIVFRKISLPWAERHLVDHLRRAARQPKRPAARAV